MSAAVMQMSIGVRDMLSNDLPVVIQIENKGYAFPWYEELFNDCLLAGYDCSVLDLGEKVIGYGIMSISGRVCHVLNLCIDTAFQCRGYGGELFDAMLERAKCLEVDRVVLEVRASNEIALNMYKNRAFNEVGRCLGYYPSIGQREDAVMLMLKV